MNLRVRLAQADDLPAVMALYRQLNLDDLEVDPHLSKMAFDAILASPHFELFVAEVAGQVVATCYLNVIPNLSRNLAPYAVLENVVTEQSLREQGIGKALVAHALTNAWQRGCYKVMLQTGSRKQSTHAFYRACGFSADDKFAFVARPPK